MTVLRFSGGETLHVSLSVAEVQGLLQRAIAENLMLELEAPDGRVLVINPAQVQYLQDGETPTPRSADQPNGSRAPIPA